MKNKINENTATLFEGPSFLEGKPKLLKEPIILWQDLIYSKSSVNEIESKFQEIYEHNLPLLAEIIFTSSCQFACRHCIYPFNFDQFNSDLSYEQWIKIILNIYDELKIKTFVHSGRSINDVGIKILRWMRSELPDVQIGLIDNGISIIPYLERLDDLKLDWIDISIDGMEEDHDIQRNKKGSFINEECLTNHLSIFFGFCCAQPQKPLNSLLASTKSYGKYKL